MRRQYLFEDAMPELPEVETIKSAIQKGIGDSNITRVSVNNNRFREIIPEDFAAKITGARITGYRRIAKYIVISLDNGLSIVWHLGMSGRVKISDSLPDKLDKHDHVVIETSRGVLIYNDARRFGMMTYCISDKLAEFPAFKHTGIDPFDQRLTAEYLYEKLKNKKRPSKLPCWIRRLSAESAIYMPPKLCSAPPFCRHERPAASAGQNAANC